MKRHTLVTKKGEMGGVLMYCLRIALLLRCAAFLTPAILCLWNVEQCYWRSITVGTYEWRRIVHMPDFSEIKYTTRYPELVTNVKSNLIISIVHSDVSWSQNVFCQKFQCYLDFHSLIKRQSNIIHNISHNSTSQFEESRQSIPTASSSVRIKATSPSPSSTAETVVDRYSCCGYSFPPWSPRVPGRLAQTHAVWEI